MASIRLRDDVKVPYFRVVIRKKGYPFFCISFETREEAEKWILNHEDLYYANPRHYIDDAVRRRKLVHRVHKRKSD